jgi:hypothetical protein
MSKHIGMPGERRQFNVTVQKAEIRDTEYGPACDHTMITPEGDILFWSASNHSTFLVAGQTYSVKATIKTHDLGEDGQPRTLLLRVMEYYEPPRRPLVAVGLSRGFRKHR